ncbi:hypothetical protein SAMN04487782_0269 [Stenotrophomonas maltophilia]|nr:hypothetical protein SAMN04487782_0269 [Stenotrophomonas maltophilia]
MSMTLIAWRWPALALLGLIAMPVAYADDRTTRADTPPCIEVQVNGERIPAWECLQRRLEPATPRARSPRLPESERLMRQPGNQLMQYNLEGTRQRMGDAFGRSVTPQRPAR